jgi:hypothetical protein
LFLEPGSSGFQSGSGVLDLTGKSERVNWQVSSASGAVAAQEGSCGLTPLEWGAIGMLGLAAAGAGVCAAYCAATPNK